jgi:hypothetical protein
MNRYNFGTDNTTGCIPARPNDGLISIQTYPPHKEDDESVLSKGKIRMQKAYD